MQHEGVHYLRSRTSAVPLLVRPDGTPELAALGALGDTATGSPPELAPRVKLSPLRNGSRLTAPPPARYRLRTA